MGRMTAQFLMSPKRDLSTAVDTLIAVGDDGALLDGLAGLRDLVETLRNSPEDRFDVPIPIVNAAAVGAIAVRRSKPGVARAAVDAMRATYSLGDLERDHANEGDARLFEAFAGGLWALGAVACERRDWELVATVIRVQPEQEFMEDLAKAFAATRRYFPPEGR